MNTNLKKNATVPAIPGRGAFKALALLAGSVALLVTVVISEATAQTATLSCPDGFNAVVLPIAPATLLKSLKTVPNPVLPIDPVTGKPILRADLTNYVADLNAAIRLGKALFWDMQVGSDDATACATCHHKAGADFRGRNQIHPGMDNSWMPWAGVNSDLSSTNFPFTDTSVTPIKDTDNTAGSQGVRKAKFASVNRKTGLESTTTVKDSVFSVGTSNVRQVTAKNAPSVINSVFNHRHFHDGRSQPEFNGVNHLGYRDSAAKVWFASGTNAAPAQLDIKIADASLASQAVAPVLNGTEMSSEGRTFPELGAKLTRRIPLGLQKVDASDSVLGSLAASGTALGLKTEYATMVKNAFKPGWWNTSKPVTLNKTDYSLIEANFSLFWGISVMLYEATLVSDDSPMDRFLASRVITSVGTTSVNYTANEALLDPVIQRFAAEGITITREMIVNGLALFELPVAPPPSYPVGTDPVTRKPTSGVGCIACHVGAETTSASVRNLTGPGIEDGDIALKNLGFDLRMERMFNFLGFDSRGPLTPVPQGTDLVTVDTATYTVKVAGIGGNLVSPAVSLPVVTYDAGWYNLGVRPTSEDLGLGGLDPFGRPLSWTEFFQKTLPNPGVIKVPGGGLASQCTPPSAPRGSPFYPEVLNPFTGLPILSGGLRANEATGVAGSFKTLPLRNVELTGPYFHNGGKATLGQVLEFYDNGGDFKNPTKSPLLVPLSLSTTQAKSLIAFLLALTDDRVLREAAPFDHPQISVPNGTVANRPAADLMVNIPAVGAAGSAPVGRFLGLNPFLPFR